MPRASLYSRGGEDRLSLYNYTADSYVPPPSTYYSRSVSRARSVSREPSVVSLRSSSLTLRSRLNNDINVKYLVFLILIAKIGYCNHFVIIDYRKSVIVIVSL